MDPTVTPKNNKKKLFIIGAIATAVLLVVFMLTRRGPTYNTETLQIYSGITSGDVKAVSSEDGKKLSLFNGKNFSELDLATGATTATTPTFKLPIIERMCWNKQRNKVVFRAKGYLEDDDLGKIIVAQNQSLDDEYWWGFDLQTKAFSFIGTDLEQCFTGNKKYPFYVTTSPFEADTEEGAEADSGDTSSVVGIGEDLRQADSYEVAGAAQTVVATDNTLYVMADIKRDADAVGVLNLIDVETKTVSQSDDAAETIYVSNDGKHSAYLQAQGSGEGDGEAEAKLTILDLNSKKTVLRDGGFSSEASLAWHNNILYIFGSDFTSKDRPYSLVQANVDTKSFTRILPNTQSKTDKGYREQPLSMTTENGRLFVLTNARTIDILSKDTVKVPTDMESKLKSIEDKDDGTYTYEVSSLGVLNITMFEDSDQAREKVFKQLREADIDINLLDYHFEYNSPLLPAPEE